LLGGVTQIKSRPLCPGQWDTTLGFGTYCSHLIPRTQAISALRMVEERRLGKCKSNLETQSVRCLGREEEGEDDGGVGLK
jgi:hypothetical protein